MSLNVGIEIDADYFLWQQSLPIHDCLTKRGGLPFVDSNFVWPLLNGDPLVFIGQLYFTESTNLLDANLGFDTLCIFTDSPLPTNEPGTIVLHMANEDSGTLFSKVEIPKGTLILPELVGVRVRLPVFPEFRHQQLYVDGYVDERILFPQGTYICKHVRSLQPSVTDVQVENGLNGLAAFSGVDVSDGIPCSYQLPKVVNENYKVVEELQQWVDLEGGAVLIGA